VPDAQRRLLSAVINGVRIVNVYIPNGSEVGSDKFFYKLTWLAQLKNFFEQHCSTQKPLVLCGDFNIAPEDRDVHDPILWYGKILCSPEERAALDQIAQWGFVDRRCVSPTSSGTRIIFLVGLPGRRLSPEFWFAD
jgi:exodeoxyribonuclease III